MDERNDSGNSGNRRKSNFKPKGNSSTSNRSQGTRTKRKCGICGTEGWYFIKQIKIEVYINMFYYIFNRSYTQNVSRKCHGLIVILQYCTLYTFHITIIKVC